MMVTDHKYLVVVMGQPGWFSADICLASSHKSQKDCSFEYEMSQLKSEVNRFDRSHCVV